MRRPRSADRLIYLLVVSSLRHIRCAVQDNKRRGTEQHRVYPVRCSSRGLAEGLPSNWIIKQTNKTIIVDRKCTVLFTVLMHFIQCKHFSETDVTSRAFQQISDLKIFPECFRGPLIALWRATCGPEACS